MSTHTSDHVLIYRIETREGKGVYQSYRHVSWCNDGRRQPAPRNDYLPWPHHDDRFGFIDMESFRSWFGSRELAVILKANNDEAPRNQMRLMVYRCSTKFMNVGGHQVTFRVNHAEKIMELPLDPKLINQL